MPKNDDKLDDFIEYSNKVYSAVSTEPVYWIDYMLTKYDLGGAGKTLIYAIAGMKEYWGQQIPEAKVGIRVPVRNPELIGKDEAHRAIKMNVNGVDIMKFKSSSDEFAKWTEEVDGDMTLVAYCTCAVNEYGGNCTPQLIIEDYYLETDWIF